MKDLTCVQCNKIITKKQGFLTIMGYSEGYYVHEVCPYVILLIEKKEHGKLELQMQNKLFSKDKATF